MMNIDSRTKPSIDIVSLLNGIYQQHPRYSGCIGHWLFNENGGGSVHDISGQKRDATLANLTLSSAWVQGEIWGGLKGDGIDGVAETTTVAFPTEATVSIWYKNTVSNPDASGYTQPFGWGNDPDGQGMNFSWDHVDDVFRQAWGLFDNGGGLYGFVQAKYTTALVANVLYNLVVSWTNNGTVNAYLNGKNEVSVSIGVLQSATTPAFTFGAGSAIPNNFDDGTVYLAQVWNRVLTPTEIMSLYTDPYLEFSWAWGMMRLEIRNIIAGAVPRIIRSYRGRRVH